MVGSPTRALGAALGATTAVAEDALALAGPLAFAFLHVAEAAGGLIEDAVNAAVEEKPQAERSWFMRSWLWRIVTRAS